MTTPFTMEMQRQLESAAGWQRRCARCRAALRSGERVVIAGDDERRRLERDLHDGAQQRLVYLSIQLRRLGFCLPPAQPRVGCSPRRKSSSRPR